MTQLQPARVFGTESVQDDLDETQRHKLSSTLWQYGNRLERDVVLGALETTMVGEEWSRGRQESAGGLDESHPVARW